MEKHTSNQDEEIIGYFEEDAKTRKDMKFKKPHMRLNLLSDRIFQNEISSESFDLTSKSLDELKQLKYSIVSPKYIKTELASPNQEKFFFEDDDSDLLHKNFKPLLLAYSKKFSNIIELNESVDSSQEIIQDSYLEIKTSFDKSLSNCFQEIKQLNYASTLEDLENSNKVLQEENYLMSLKIEQAYKESRSAIGNIEDSVIQMLKHNLKNYQGSIIIFQEKLKNYQDKFFFQILKFTESLNYKLAKNRYLILILKTDKFFFQILKFTESLNYKLAKNDGKMQKLEKLYQRLKQNLIISNTKCINLEKKYEEILHERIVLQERSENKTSMILNMRMAIESMNFARDQVSKLPNFESKKILQVFLDKILAFEQAIEVFAKICDKNEDISDIYVTLNKENKILKRKLSVEYKNTGNFRADLEEFSKFIYSIAFEIEDVVNKKLVAFDEKIKYLKDFVGKVIEKKTDQKNKDLITLIEELNRKIIEKNEENIELIKKNNEVFEKYECNLKAVNEFDMVKNENTNLIKKLEEIERYQYKISMITNENTKLLSKLEELEKYKYEFNIITNENAKLIEKLKDYQKYQQELSSLSNENTFLISKLEELEKSQSQLSVLANENANLISEIQEHKKSQHESAKIIHELSIKNAKLLSDLEFIALEKAEITILIGDKHKKLQQAESKIKELDEKCCKFEKHKVELERVIEIMTKTHRDEISVCRSQNSIEGSLTMSQTLQKISLTNEKISEITDGKNKEIDLLKQSQEILQNTNKELIKKCGNLEKKIEELEALEKNSKLIKEKNREIENLQHKIENMSESNSKLMKKLKKKTREITNLKKANKFLTEYDKKSEIISSQSFIEKDKSGKFVFGEEENLNKNYGRQLRAQQTEISQVITISITPTNFHKRNKSLIDVENLFLSKIYIEKIREILNQDETLNEKPKLDAESMTVIEAFEVLDINYIQLKDKVKNKEKEKNELLEEANKKIFNLTKKCANLENTLKINHEELRKSKETIDSQSKSLNESLQKISELHQELENSESKIVSLQKQTESIEESFKPSKEFLKSLKYLKIKQKTIKKSWLITKQAQDLIGSYTQSYISQMETLIEKLKSQEEVIGLLEEKLRKLGMMYENEDNNMKKYKKKYKILIDKFNELTSDYEVVYREYTYVNEELQSQKSLNNERMAGTISLYEGKIKELTDELNASKV
ncbi:hypothetical protein SteCoe_8496 [Stentor coeruleus]|uniref:Uncharacterized protein n=1 Tax=Stentor coeruleus TaxID=5963 RepID=A0A1R2CK29_9CILI|nr:hypothetical protein SteCoe_8496 [Stentor coeruleus]